MRERVEGAGCAPQIIAVVAIVACLVVTLLAFGVLRLDPLRSGSVRIEASANPTTAQAGDLVTYTVTLYNVEIRDGVQILTVTDSLLGDLSGAFVSTLAEGTSDREIFTRVVQPGDSDPLSNTLTVYAQGARRAYSDTTSVTVELFKPIIRVETSVSPPTAARGETVAYSVSVANVGEIPVDVTSVADSLLGDLTGDFPETLPPGVAEEQSFDWTVPTDPADPLDRTVTVSVAGAGQVISATAAAELSLLRPAVQVASSVSPQAAVRGDVVTYTLAISNVGRVDLRAVRVTDSQLGDLSPRFPAALPAGSVERRTFAWPVPLDASGSLERSVTVEAAGAGEEVSDAASATLIVAGLQVAVTGTDWARQGDPVTYTLAITNTAPSGALDLVLEGVTDFEGVLTDEMPEACRTLPAGETCTFSYGAVAPAGPGSFTNTIEVRYRPRDLDGTVVGVASHTVEVRQVSISLDSDGPARAQPGERVTYLATVTNDSSPGTPDLILEAATLAQDDDLTVPAECETLAAGQSCTFSYDAVVPPDQDPVVSEVEVRYRPAGFTDLVSAAASHSIDVFQPEITLAVGGDALSQAGESVVHRVTITNTSSPDAPNLVLENASDSRGSELAVPGRCRTLAADETCAFSYDLVVPSGEDPLTTEIEVDYRPEGFTGVVSASASHSVEIFQPSVTVEKAGPTAGVEGQQLTYTVTVINSGSDDAPPLVLDAIADTLGGDLTRQSEDVTSSCGEQLASGERCQISYPYTPGPADAAPLVNTVRVEGHPDGFGGVVRASADHTLTVAVPWQRGAGLPDGVEVRALAVCPDDPQILYAGFGSHGSGVYRTTDVGRNWLSTALENQEIFGLAVDPRDCDTVYAAAWRDGVRRSEDGGRSWEVASEGFETAFVYTVVINPANPEALFAGTAQRGVYRSEDAGRTWRTWDLDSLTVPYLSVAPDGRTVYAATWGDGLYRRRRTGVGWGSWSAVNDGLPQEHRQVYAVTVDPEQDATVFAATAAGGVYRTLDAGARWEQVLPSPRTAYAVAVGRQQGVVYAGTSLGVYRSTATGDAGSWEPLNVGLEGLSVRSVDAGPAEAQYIHVGTSDGAWRYPR